MIDIFLFEIECAESIGAYKIADDLDRQLVKLASQDYKKVRKSLRKNFVEKNIVKEIDFSNSQNKFIVYSTPNLSSSEKRKIKELATPYAVSFRTASKEPPSFFSNKTLTLDDVLPIDPTDLDDREPTDEELRLISEFPYDNDLTELDELYLVDALEKLKERGII